MSDSAFWWQNDEPDSDRVLRTLIQIAGKLDRLPTFEEVESGPDGLSMMEISIHFGSFPQAMCKVARLLYGHDARKSPEDLVLAQRGLSPAEQTTAKREQRVIYEERLRLLSEPGGLKQYREEQQLKARNRGINPSKITHLPSPSRRNRIASLAPKPKPSPKPEPATPAPTSKSWHPPPEPIPGPIPEFKLEPMLPPDPEPIDEFAPEPAAPLPDFPEPTTERTPEPQLAEPPVVEPPPVSSEESGESPAALESVKEEPAKPTPAPEEEPAATEPPPEPEFIEQEPVLTPDPESIIESTPKEVLKMPRPKDRRYTMDDILGTVRALRQQFGNVLPGQPEVEKYLREHEELATYSATYHRLGPKANWFKILDGTMPPRPPKSLSGKSASSSTAPTAPNSDNAIIAGNNTEPTVEPAPLTEEPTSEEASKSIQSLAPESPNESSTQQISVPLPSIAGTMKLAVELSNHSLTLHISFDPPA